MGDCQKCRHYRPVLRPSVLIKQALNTNDATVTRAIAEIEQDEARQAGEEANEIRRKAIGRDLKWDRKPTVFDACGIREDAGVYLIPDIKNAGARCKDEAGQRQRESCATCPYRVAARGPAEDEKLWQISLSLELTDQSSHGAVAKHDAQVGNRKAQELQLAYRSRGAMSHEPRYFDYCGKRRRSATDPYVLCIFINPHDSCHYHPEHQHSSTASGDQ